MSLVTIGILTPSPDFSATVKAHLKGAGLGTVVAEASEHIQTRTDRQIRRILEARPDVLLINGEDVSASLISIQVLHTVAPSAWILVCTPAGDAETILKFVRAGARELISLPLMQDKLAQALHRYAEERDRQHKTDVQVSGRIYAVCSAKRGSGATTTAINVAASLAEDQNSKVALIDMDWPIGDTAAFLDIKPRFTVSDALAAAGRLDSVLLESYMHKHDRFHVLAGLEDLGTNHMFEPAAVSQLLEVVAQTYTHSVVDLPFNLPRDVFQTVVGITNVIVTVLTPDLPSLRRTERFLRFLNAIDAGDKVRLILNRSRKSDDITDGDVERSLRQPVASKVANDYYACMEAINSGKALQSISSKQLARDFRNVARQLMGQEGEEKRKGLFSLLPRTSF